MKFPQETTFECRVLTHNPRFVVSPRYRPRSRCAFTLIEVMIALGIFFAATFSILALISSLLRNARNLQRPQVDAGMAAAIYVNTNRFSVGSVSGDLSESLPDFSYEVATDEFATNGLLQAEVVLRRRGAHENPDVINILVFDPNFNSTPFSGRR